MENDQKKLNFGKPLLFFFAFVVAIAVLFGVFSAYNQKRENDVYQVYANETQQYIDTNRSALTTVFTKIFPNDVVCQTNIAPNGSTSCPKVSGDDIAKLLPSTLKDWSSTSFIKKGSEGIMLTMSLSGDYGRANIYPDDNAILVEKLLSGEVSSVPWDNYTSQFSEKQVIILVKDASGKIIGALVRGVIEKK